MRLLAASLAAVVLLAHVPALAQATEQYKAALKLENAGDLVGALAGFEAIPAAKRDFNTRLHIAGCKKKLGRLLDAEKEYESIRTDPKADPATVDTAASDLEDLRTRIPKLIVKTSAATSGVTVTVDAKETKTPTTLSLDPGAHSIVATRNGAQVFKRDVNLAESTTIEVEVDAPAAASAPVVTTAPAVTTTPAKDETPVPASSSQKTWGYVSLGAGGVFLLGAGGSYLLSSKAYDDYQASCGPTICTRDQSSVRTWETMTIVSGVTAVVAIGVGVTLLVTAPKDNAVQVKASLGGVSLEGRF